MTHTHTHYDHRLQTLETSRPRPTGRFSSHLIGRFPAKPSVKLISWLRNPAMILSNEAVVAVEAVEAEESGSRG